MSTKTVKKETLPTTTKAETSLTLPEGLQGSWGNENIEAKDVLIPRIFVAQKMSEVCDTEEVKAGEFYRSTNHEVIGGPKKAAEVLVLSSFKTWTIEKKEGDRYVFESIKPYVPADAGLPWDFTEEGLTKRRNETFNFYVILPQDILTGEVLPSVLSFRRTAVICAKQITSFMMHMRQFNAPACSYVLELTTMLKENDLGSFHVPQMKKGRKATIEEMVICRQWYDAISKGAVKVAPDEVEPKETDEDVQF